MKPYVTQTSKFKVWSPAQLISCENLEPRPITDIVAAHKNRREIATFC
jgi:hypothetical protein